MLIHPSSEVLVVIGAQLNVCLGLILSIANSVVTFVLGLVAHLNVNVELHVIVVKITTCIGQITNTCSGLTGILAPVLDLLHL